MVGSARHIRYFREGEQIRECVFDVRASSAKLTVHVPPSSGFRRAAALLEERIIVPLPGEKPSAPVFGCFASAHVPQRTDETPQFPARCRLGTHGKAHPYKSLLVLHAALNPSLRKSFQYGFKQA